MDITSNQTVYRFPILKNAEIIECLSEAGIDITESELTEPHRHKDKVKSIFLSLVELGLGFNEDHFKNLSSAQMKYRQSLPYPDLHEDSFCNFKFFRACQKFQRVCGNEDGFGLIDLGAPTKMRFKRQLSAAINFIKFREDRLVLYAELHEQREELLVGLDEVKREKAKLEQDLLQAKAEADKRWDEAKFIENDCGELQGEIAQQNKLQRSLRGESEELKKQASLLKDKIATAELAFKEMEAEERKLLPKVVDSPDALKMQIAELNVRLSQEKTRALEAEQEVRLVDLRVRNVTKAQNDIALATKLADEMMSEQGRFEKLAEEVDDIQQVIDANHDKVKKLEQVRNNHKTKLEQIGKCFLFKLCK